MQTGASRRLLERCAGPRSVRLRSRPGTFDWLEALRQRRLIAFDGGGIRSREIKRTLFLLVSHAGHPRRPPAFRGDSGRCRRARAGRGGARARDAVRAERAAGAAEGRARDPPHHAVAARLRGPGLFEAVLANTPWQAWYLVLSPADQELGAGCSPTPPSIRWPSTSRADQYVVPVGSDPVKTVSRGPGGKHMGTAFRTRYREVIEPYYKSPQTARTGVQNKAGHPRGRRTLRARWQRRAFERMAALGSSPAARPVRGIRPDRHGRIRQQPIYQNTPPVTSRRDARRAGRGRRWYRRRPPARRAPGGVPPLTPNGRPPGGPADDGTAPARRTGPAPSA